MARIHKYDIDPVDVDPNGIAEAQTPAAGGIQNLTLDGALISGGTYTAGDGDAARQVVIGAAATDETGKTFTVTGTDADGKAQSEIIVGPSSGVTEGTKYFKTVTSIAASADTTGDVTAGTVDELASPTYPLDRWSDAGALVQVEVTGTIDFTVEVTNQDINRTDIPTDQSAIAWVATTATALVTTAADAIGNIDAGANAMRVIINSHSSGGEIQVYVTQSRD
jgi:hypothetical protein